MKAQSFAVVAMVAIGAGISVPADAQAIILSPATISQHVGSQVTYAPRTNGTTVNTYGPVADSTSGVAGYPYQGQGSASGSAAPMPSPSLSATASFSAAALPNIYVDPTSGTSGDFASGGSYNGSVQHWMEIFGPTPTVALTVSAMSALQTSALTNNTSVQAFLNFGVRSYSDVNGNGPLVVSDTTTFNAIVGGNGAVLGYRSSSDVLGNALAGFNGGFSESGTYTFDTGSLYLVSLQDMISISGFGANYNSSGYVSGMIDPTFRIADSVGNASDYSIVFSPGIGNSGANAVPEPASWAMMIVGFGAVGSAMRRRQRQCRLHPFSSTIAADQGRRIAINALTTIAQEVF